MADVKAAIYLRQSQDRDGTALGVERQREDVERMISARGWTVVETFIDNDVSATSRKPRPAFERMMAAVDRGDIEVVTARHMDRLLRRLADLETVIERCEKVGAFICTAADGVDTSTDGGRLVARILASVGQGEVERKSARQRSATAQAAKQGRRVGGRRPFGYEADGATIRESEAVHLRAAYESVLAGDSLASIARRINAAGVPGAQPRRDGSPSWWSSQNLREVLVNPRNAALRRHRPTGYHQAARNDPEAFIVGPAAWPPIVPEETWRATVRILTDPRRRHRPNAPKALLTGLATCGACGGKVHAGGYTHGSQGYRCADRGCFQRKGEPCDTFVRAAAVARLSQPDALSMFAAPDVAADVDALRIEADTLRRRLDDVAEDYAEGVLTREQLRTVNTRIRDRLAAIETDLAAAGSADIVAPIITSGDVREAFDALPTDRQRAILDAIMVVQLHPIGRGTRTFRPESIGIEWKGGEQ